MTDDEIQRLIDEGKAETKHTAVLKQLGPNVFCIHRSWGFGRIVRYDAILGKFLIDFQNKQSHPMDVHYAISSLELLPDSHILARRVTDLDALKKLAVEQPLELMRVVLTSYKGQANADQIAAALTPVVIPTSEWKRWWEGAKRVMKKDLHFGVAVRKNDPCVLRDQPVRLEEEHLKAFTGMSSLKQKVTSAEQLLRVADQIPDLPTVLAPVIRSLSDDIKNSMHRDPATTLEAIWIRDELSSLCGEQPHHTVEQIHDVIKNVRHLGELLDALPSIKQKRLLPHLRTAYPDTWHDSLRQIIMTSDAKLVGDIIEFLIAEGQAELVRIFLDRVVREQSAPSNLLLWLCRSRNQQNLSKALAPLMGAKLASAILQSLQREQLEVSRRKNQLLEYFVSDVSLMTDLLRVADIEDARDIARKLLIHPAISEMDRRSLLARIIKLHPPVQALLTVNSEVRQQTLFVSWESLEQRKIEFDDLESKKIPANVRDIATARSYGDLRENFEFKAAKEMQRVLQTRKQELELMLANARGTDFSDAKTEAIGIGTCVTLTDLDENKSVRYSILGAWDSDVERNIISYQTALAQALLNKKTGEEAEFEIGGQRHRVRVEKIERYADLKAEIGPPFIPKPVVATEESAASEPGKSSATPANS